MSFGLDYDRFAPGYAATRRALPWVLDPLVAEARRLVAGAAVLEIGCGTGNYIVSVAGRRTDLRYRGFDLSREMLRIASARGAAVEFAVGDAATSFPYTDASFDLAYAVDVMHYIRPLDRFFDEAARVLAAGARLVIVTDSEDDLRRRSLSLLFPEILAVDLARYPAIETLCDAARAAGLRTAEVRRIEGALPLDEAFIASLAGKCSSGMRIISEDAHRRGVERAREAGARGESYLSLYTMLFFERIPADTRGTS